MYGFPKRFARSVTACLVCFACGMAGPAPAAVALPVIKNISTGFTYTSLASAVSAVRSGEILELLESATYISENVTIAVGNVTLRAASGMTPTLDGNYKDYCLRVGANGVRVSGIAFVNGDTYGIKVENASDMATREVDRIIMVVSHIISRRLAGEDLELVDPYSSVSEENPNLLEHDSFEGSPNYALHNLGCLTDLLCQAPRLLILEWLAYMRYRHPEFCSAKSGDPLERKPIIRTCSVGAVRTDPFDPDASVIIR